MPLSPGTALGANEIVALIGAGGMGEVYRARDTTLNRAVAIKVLLPAVANDPDRLARFSREAQALASLNHPNIAHVYGLDKQAGQDTRSTVFIVMELVDGDELAQRIERGPVAWDEALPIAKQIAAALETAHGQGIIHRDLKPANIKLTPDGMVKVLDFGLAKLHDPNISSSDSHALAMSPTITSPAMMTGVGLILGTAAYMSPEQARGRPVDRRADVWAFGCVLYEMLTGKRAFEGEDVSETLASVLKSQPDWSALPSSVPPAISTLIRRCLDKDRARRVADAATVAYVLDEAGSLAPAGDSSTMMPGAARRDGMRRWLLPLSLAAFMATAVGVAVWSLRPPLPRPVVTRFALSIPKGTVTSLGRNLLAVSPDGMRLVYYVDGRPVLRDLSEFEARAVPGAFGRAAFSPDGQSLAVYSAADNTIKRLEVGGGAAVTVCRSDDVYNMTWDTSGIISGQGARGVFRCRTDGAAPEQLASVEKDEVADQPQILPDGKAVLFTIARIADGPTRWDTARIVVQSLTSKERKTLVDGGSSGRYVPSGHLLYARGGIVFAVPFDAARRQITGRAVGVVEGVSRAGGGVTGGAHFTVSNTGHLFYISGPVNTAASERAIAQADRAGVVTRLPIPPGPYVQTRVSRDGKSLAVGTDDGRNAAIWTYRLDGKTAMQRLTLEGRNQFPVWSPDGERVAFQSDRGGDKAIFVQRVDGSKPAERLTKPEAIDAHVPESWSPDGRYLLFSLGRGSTFTLWSLSVADGKIVPLGVTSENTTGACFRPTADGSPFQKPPVRWDRDRVTAGFRSSHFQRRVPNTRRRKCKSIFIRCGPRTEKR